MEDTTLQIDDTGTALVPEITSWEQAQSEGQVLGAQTVNPSPRADETLGSIAPLSLSGWIWTLLLVLLLIVVSLSLYNLLQEDSRAWRL